MSAPRLLIVCCSGVAVLVSGCAAGMNTKPLASLRRVRREVVDGLEGVLEDTRRQAATTWADVWHDWNYVDDDRFRDIRNAAGQ